MTNITYAELEKVLSEFVQKFNPYHVPAGSPPGGQFTDEGSGVFVSTGQSTKRGKKSEKGKPKTQARKDGFDEWKDKSVEEQGKILDRSVSGVLKDATAEEAEAVESYLGPGYRDVNGELRKPGAISRGELLGSKDENVKKRRLEQAERTTKEMDKLIDKSSIPEDAVVYRATSATGVGISSAEDIDFLVGQTIQDKGFSSTSIDRGAVGQFTTTGSAIMEINVPKGSKGLYTASLSEFPEERELLLPRGSRFVVTGVTAGKTVPVGVGIGSIVTTPIIQVDLIQ